MIEYLFYSSIWSAAGLAVGFVLGRIYERHYRKK